MLDVVATGLSKLESSVLADWAGGAVYPLISGLHVLSIGFVVVPILLADLRILQLGEADARARAHARLALVSFGAAAVTGGLLFTVQPVEYAENRAFAIKIALMAAAGLNAGVFGTLSGSHRAAAILSATLWLGVLFAGRWIAFVV